MNKSVSFFKLCRPLPTAAAGRKIHYAGRVITKPAYPFQGAPVFKAFFLYNVSLTGESPGE